MVRPRRHKWSDLRESFVNISFEMYYNKMLNLIIINIFFFFIDSRGCKRIQEGKKKSK